MGTNDGGLEAPTEGGVNAFVLADEASVASAIAVSVWFSFERDFVVSTFCGRK